MIIWDIVTKFELLEYALFLYSGEHLQCHEFFGETTYNRYDKLRAKQI